MPSRHREPIWKYLIVVLIVMTVVEAMAFGAGKFLASFGVVYDPQPMAGYDAYLARRDPLLGWTAADFWPDEVDGTGSRINSRYPESDSPCVSVFGDSFTWGDEVVVEASFPDQLSGLLGCRVANYGVGGYGSDQAFLRFRDRVRDDASVVVLAHLSENIVRNVNQFRGFVSGFPYGLKPRFVLDDRALRHIPLPTLTATEFAVIHREADSLVPYDFFRPNGGAGTRVLRFPYLVSLVGALSDPRVRDRLKGMPAWETFYRPAHPAGGLDVTVAVLQAFHDDAVARGQRPVVLLIPTLWDLQRLQETGKLPYAPLETALDSVGIATPGVVHRMLEELGGRDPCDLYMGCVIHRHFNREGSAVLAEVLYEWLSREELVETDD